MSLKLYYHPLSTYSRRVLIVLAEKQIPHELSIVDMPARRHREQPYLSLNPYGRVPTLQEDEFVLFESTAILNYLEATHPTPPLAPADSRGRALVNMHMKLCDLQLTRHAGTIIFPKRFLPKERWNTAAIAEAKQEIEKHFAILDKHLSERTYLVAEQFSLADVCYAPFLEFLPLMEIAPSTAIAAWSERVIFGFVAPIGAEINECVAAFKSYFEQANYNVLEIKVTDVFKLLEPYLPPKTALVQRPLNERYNTHIAYGNQIREFFEDDSTLSALTIGRLIRRRLQKGAPVDQAFTKNVYLIHQFKRKEEIDLLRSVYGRLFFQISVYSRRGARVDYLSRKFAQDANSANANAFRSRAEAIIDKDENQSGEDHGQRVAKIFHDGDLIINTDVIAVSVPQQGREIL